MTNESSRERRRRIRETARTARHCADCGRALAPQEPVWRHRISLGPGFLGFGWRYGVAPCCEQCRSTWRPYAPVVPCEGCGRPVHNGRTCRTRRHTFCCEVCKLQAVNADARQKRALTRNTMPCEGCGETFEPKRTDARYCSAACRQRVYRKRVTANECHLSEIFENRNATACPGHNGS
jgi:hypothetical protein